MMRKYFSRKNIALMSLGGLTILLAGLIFIVTTITSNEETNQPSFQPIERADLDEIETYLESSMQASDDSSQQDPELELSVRDNQPQKPAAAFLEHALSPYNRIKTHENKAFLDKSKYWLHLASWKIGLAGPEIHRSSIIGLELFQKGEWEAAEPYLWDGINTYKSTDSPEHPFFFPRLIRLSFHTLATMEPDGEIATRYLELSTKGLFETPEERRMRIKEAIELSEKRNSSTLAGYYRLLLQQEFGE